VKTVPVCEPALLGNELQYITEAVSGGWISSAGRFVSAFEKSFAAYCGVEHGIAVCNGTVALHLMLRALNIGPGDEVIIPDFTMIASALAVRYTGATPVLVDADAGSWNIAPHDVEAAITSRTRAIMAVHIFGVPCDMDALAAIADRYNIALVEDAAEAHGAEWKGRKAGSLSRIAGFSFFANKNITTGEGGMVVTDDPELASACRYFRNLCFPLNAPRTYLHSDIGFNYRMSNLHAALGLAQTEKADEYRAMRIRNGEQYRARLSDIPGIRLQALDQRGKAVFWMNGLCITPEYGKSRDALVEHLKNNGIETRLFFQGMSRQPALKGISRAAGNFAVSDFLADHGLYLPSSSTLSTEDIDRITGLIADFRIL
jgi:perosamine synthetase